MPSYDVPLSDPLTGDEWEVSVHAENAQDAVIIATDGLDDDVQVASSFIREHAEVSQADV